MEGLVLLILVVYFLPAVIAISRNHHSAMAVFVLNLLLGWTFLGWVLALVWAYTYVIPEAARRNRSPPRPSAPPPLPTAPNPATGARYYRVAAVGIVVLGLVAAGSFIGQQRRAVITAPTTEPTIPPTQYVAPITPAVVPQAKQIDPAEKVKREAERHQWCRAEMKKPEAKRSDRTKFVCSEISAANAR